MPDAAVGVDGGADGAEADGSGELGALVAGATGAAELELLALGVELADAGAARLVLEPSESPEIAALSSAGLGAPVCVPALAGAVGRGSGGSPERGAGAP
ncbi:MAG TPA: hypothetical protein VK538_02770, partial [Solirubrobacteraceae bacterium]|nr:hypothetical protein [Solirubrobacteraceae bacterium]